MQDRSNIQQNWYSFGSIEKNDLGYVVRDLLLRWNERQETRLTDSGQVVEYVYDAYKLNYQLPVEVSPGREAVKYYLTQMQDAIIQLAQNALEQEGGFNAI